MALFLFQHKAGFLKTWFDKFGVAELERPPQSPALTNTFGMYQNTYYESGLITPHQYLTLWMIFWRDVHTFLQVHFKILWKALPDNWRLLWEGWGRLKLINVHGFGMGCPTSSCGCDRWVSAFVRKSIESLWPPSTAYPARWYLIEFNISKTPTTYVSCFCQNAVRSSCIARLIWIVKHLFDKTYSCLSSSVSGKITALVRIVAEHQIKI